MSHSYVPITLYREREVVENNLLNAKMRQNWRSDYNLREYQQDTDYPGQSLSRNCPGLLWENAGTWLGRELWAP